LKSIRYCIDDILVAEDQTKLVITGWAYAESKQQIKIDVLNVDDLSVEIFERPDIFHQYKEEPAALKSGFKITIPYKSKNQIVFSTKEEKLTCNFTSDDKKKAQKDGNKIERLIHIFSFDNIGKIFKYLKQYGLVYTFTRIKRIFIKTSLKGIKYNHNNLHPNAIQQ